MKKIAVLSGIFALIGSFAAEAQTTQKGVVKEFNSGGSPVAGVQIAAMGAAATDSDGDGRFVLEFSSMSPGTLISLPEIYKKGYEVVNADAFNGWILSEKKDMNIVLAKAGVIEEARNRYYEVAVANYSRKQSELVGQLNQMYRQGEIDASQRRDKLEELSAQSQEFMSRLDEYADKFARINPDDVSELEKKVIGLVSEGKIDEAIQLYDGSGIVEDALEKIVQAKEASEDAREIVESLYRYADLVALSGEKAADLKIVDIYRRIAEAFPEDYGYMFKYATEVLTFDYDARAPLIDRCMELAYDDKSLVQVLSMKVTLNYSTRRYAEALAAAGQAEQILLDKEVNMPSGDQMALYANLMRMKGSSLTSMNEIDEARNVLSDLAEMIEDVLKDSDNPVLNDILSSMLPNVYDLLSDTCTSDPEAADAYARKGYEAALAYAGDDEIDILQATISYKQRQLSHAQQVMDFQRILELSGDICDMEAELYKSRPYAIIAYQYALTVNLHVLMLFNTDVDAAFAKLQELENMLATEWTTVSGQNKAILEYMVDQLYVTYYAFKADYAKRFEYSVAIQEHVNVLREYDMIANLNKILTGYSYLLQMYNMTQQKEAALALAYEVDAMYSMAKARGHEDTAVAGDIATAYMMGGDVDLALEYFEDIRAWRENYILNNPNDWEMKANILSTYNNLALCYSTKKKYRKAFEMQKNAIEQFTPMYQANKVPYGQNYFSMLLNVALYAYQSGDEDVAEAYLADIDAVAEDLSNLNPNYVTYPLIAKFMRGDYLLMTGKPEGKAMVNDVLSYRQGSMSNDFLLMYLMNEYGTKGGIFVK